MPNSLWKLRSEQIPDSFMLGHVSDEGGGRNSPLQSRVAVRLSWSGQLASWGGWSSWTRSGNEGDPLKEGVFFALLRLPLGVGEGRSGQPRKCQVGTRPRMAACTKFLPGVNKWK